MLTAEERVGERLAFGVDVRPEVDAPAPEVERLTETTDVGRGFVDHDVDAAVHEVVRGREAGRPGPEHRYPRRSGLPRCVTAHVPLRCAASRVRVRAERTRCPANERHEPLPRRATRRYPRRT